MFRKISAQLLVLLSVSGLVACGGGETVEIPGNNVSAVVTTVPFSITIKDGDGNEVLSSVSSLTPLISPLCYYAEPNIDGNLVSIPASACDTYSALHVEVGQPEAFAFTDLVFTELMSVTRTTNLYHATNVIEGQAHGDGVLFTVATNLDGLTIDVIVEPDPSGGQAMRISAKTDFPNVQNINFGFNSAPGEAFYGFGGRRGTLDHRGKELYSYSMEGMGMSGFIPEYTLKRAYGPQALFYSSEGYGFLLENQEIARFYMANHRDDAWRFNVSSNEAAFVVSSGDYKQNIETITAINGRHRPLPEWAKGFIFSHATHVLPGLIEQYTGIPTEPGAYLAKSLDHLAKLDQYGMHPTGYVIESWEAKEVVLTDPERETLLAELDARDIRPMSYNRMMVAADNIQTEDPWIFHEAVDGGHLATDQYGEQYVYETWGAETGALDYTSPAAVAFWRERVWQQLDEGSEGFMLDFGEQIRPDMHFSNGEDGLSMHNAYAALGAKVTSELLDDYMAANPGRELFLFTRSNYSGRPGSPAFENAQFPGDNSQSWDANTGLKAVLPDLLNRGLGGAFNGTTEIGGYADYGTFVDGELFTRWQQFATFIPMFRVHNSPMTGMKGPWTWPEAIQPFKDTLALRERAMPYMNRVWDEAHSTGIPLWRPMWLEFPGDARMRNLMEQFMLGSEVLVAPVMDQGARSKRVILPQGCWSYQVTGEQFQGGTTVTVSAPFDRLPYFFRCGETPF